MPDKFGLPTLQDIETLAMAACASLPTRIAQLCGGIVVRVEESPDQETLVRTNSESQLDILGIYCNGDGARRYTPSETESPAAVVVLYREPILDYWKQEHSSEPLRSVVRYVLVYQVARHFGLTDEDIAELG